jgi:4-amino-4-deoxy-L-arabinose transferase-like glycosyltransferase
MTLPGLGVGTLWDNSETAYGEVAREILITHNWVIMHFNAVPYFVQPPLYFWLAAFFSLFLGPTSFALRLPSALATIALAAMTGYAVSRQAGTRIGIYASVILSSCLMLAVIGRLAIMDALLDLAVAMAIFWWFRGLETGRDRYFVYGWAAAGFGFLAKGLVAPVVALLVIVPFYFWNRRHESTFAPSARAWTIGAIAFFAIVLPWPLALISHYHLFPIVKLFGQYTFGRYTGIIENQSGPIWYYLPVLLLGFFPWMAFLPMATIYAVRELYAIPQNPQLARLVRLALTWIVVPLLFFSLARTKLPNYIALEFPALALLTALYFEAVVRKGGTRSAVISASFGPVTIGLLAIAIALFIHNNKLGTTVAPHRSLQTDSTFGRHHQPRAQSLRRGCDPKHVGRERAPVLHASRRRGAGAADRRRRGRRRRRSPGRDLRRSARLGHRTQAAPRLRSDLRPAPPSDRHRHAGRTVPVRRPAL